MVFWSEFVDSGIDYENPDFRNEDGTTRGRVAVGSVGIGKSSCRICLWGSEFTREEINAALAGNGPGGGCGGKSTRTVLSRDTSGHGTAVAGIAAGNGRGSEGAGCYRGCGFGGGAYYRENGGLRVRTDSRVPPN